MSARQSKSFKTSHVEMQFAAVCVEIQEQNSFKGFDLLQSAADRRLLQYVFYSVTVSNMWSLLLKLLQIFVNHKML